MGEFFARLFSSDFMPHGHCYFWQPSILWLHVISDAVIALSYYSIPVCILYFVRRRKDITFTAVFILFAAFIFACGTTHLLDIWTVWHGTYRIEGVVKLFTALVSAITAGLLWPLLPRALRAPRLSELQHELSRRMQSEAALQHSQSQLEERIEARAQELARSELRYRLLVESIDAVTWSTDDSGNFTDPQSSWSTLTGQVGDEQLQHGWMVKIHPDDLSNFKLLLEHALEHRQTLSGVIRIWGAQFQSYRFTQLRAVPEPGDDDHAPQWVWMGIDIHDRRTAEERFRIAVEAAPNAMLLVDEGGAIQLANSEAKRLFHYELEELIGSKVELLVPSTLRARHQEYRDGFFKSAQRRNMGEGRDLFGIRKDGTQVPVEIGLNPIEVGTSRFVICAIVDISDRLQASALERRYAEELERSNRELDQFAYAASHDLRAPLRAIDNLSRWLMEDIGEQVPPESKRHMELLQQRTQRMERLLTDLLQYSRAGRGEDLIEEVDLRTMCLEIYELLGAPKEVVLNIAADMPVVKTKRIPLEQSVRNLISNAIKHHDKPIVTIWISGGNDNGFLKLQVRDDGPGIASEYHELIFKMFKTLRPRDEVEGSGLGLSMVRKLADSVGGSVVVTSAPGEGATFTLRWPIFS